MRVAAAAAAVLLAGGCAQQLVRPSAEELRIGETTPEQVIQRVGRKPELGRLERNGKTLQVVAFSQDAQWERPHGYDGVIPGRTQLYYFLDGRLVGHEFNSTVESDHTDFSPRPLREVVRGKTTRDEVTRLFGRPTGYFVFPLVEAGSAMLFSYREARRVPFGKPTVYSKSLVIYLDESGIVHDFNYTTSGTP